MSKTVYLLRGCSGSGKSTLAAELAPASHICCADDYHMEDGVYKWSVDNLYEAHFQCFQKFFSLLEKGYGPIVVDNTNTAEREFKKYLDAAADFGYTVISLVVENRHGGVDSHNVPQCTLATQERRILASLQLRPHPKQV